MDMEIIQVTSSGIYATSSTSNSSEDVWKGFTKPDTGYLKVHNDDLVEMMSQVDSLAELKIILYVMRHTWGFQEYDTFKKITIDEFRNGRKLRNRTRMDNGTGLGMTAVRDGIAKALEHGFLECEADYSDLARVKKCYRLKMKPSDSATPKTNHEQSIKQDKSKEHKTRLQELQSMPYDEYLKTNEWAKKRAKALRFAGYKCQLCNSAEGLNVHHRTYERLGREHMGDLTVLCKNCHEIFHNNGELVK